jgi:hypothetical protein
VHAVEHANEPKAIALTQGIHGRARGIKCNELLTLQRQQRRHVRPQHAAQLTDARAAVGARQKRLLLVRPHFDFDAFTAVAVKPV